MTPPVQVTLSDVKRALQELGGEAVWDKIIDQVTKNRNGDYAYYKDWNSYSKTANQIIQTHCLGYKKFKGSVCFEEVGGKFRLVAS